MKRNDREFIVKANFLQMFIKFDIKTAWANIRNSPSRCDADIAYIEGILKNGNFFERLAYKLFKPYLELHNERISKENSDEFSIVFDNINSAIVFTVNGDVFNKVQVIKTTNHEAFFILDDGVLKIGHDSFGIGVGGEIWSGNKSTHLMKHYTEHTQFPKLRMMMYSTLKEILFEQKTASGELCQQV